VGGEERGYDGVKKIKGRKRHLFVDTEGFVLRAKVHSAKVMDWDGIKSLLQQADRQFPRLKHLWVDALALPGRGQGKGLGGEEAWMERGSRRAPTQACPKGSAHRMGLKQWLHEGVKVDWEKLLAPKGFVVLPRRRVVERSFAWISHNRRMRVRTTRGYVCGRGSVRICCHDSTDGEAVGSLMRLFHTVSLGRWVNRRERMSNIGRCAG
jgi:putative transposase